MSVLEDLDDEEAYLWALLSDPSGLDQAEFLWFDAEQDDDCFRAWAFQWDWWRTRAPQQIDQAARSVGKALDVSTVVPTPYGWKEMGDIQVGDLVYDENGTQTNVVKAHDVLYDRECFEVVFDDGSSVVADADHQWLTWQALDWKAHRRRGHGLPAITTTRKIRDTLRHGKEANHRIPVAGTLEGRNVDLPLDPYLIGFWLGDGDSMQAALTVGDQDIDSVQVILGAGGYELLPMAGPMHYKITRVDAVTEWEWVDQTDCDEYRPKRGTITNEEVRCLRELAHQGVPLSRLAGHFGVTPASVTQLVRGQFRRGAGGWIRGDITGSEVSRDLRLLGLIGNKHIPEVLLRASADQRISLLQGLMDSDGHCTKAAGRCEITLKDEYLARQVAELVTSLGQRVFFEKRTAYCNGVDAGPVYRVGFVPRELMPFRLVRKADRVRKLSRRSESRLAQRRIVGVRSVPTRPVRCIEVDSPSHLFLAGTSMIPTHNSLSIKVRAFAFPFVNPEQEMVITAPEGVHLEAVTDNVETMFTSTQIGRAMLKGGRQHGAIKHKPFLMNFANGARIMGRIPQHDGKGMKGTHPLWLELDEAQDYPEKGWTEIFETVKRGSKGSMWRAHGVTRGGRDAFFKFTQEAAGWTVHRWCAMHRPTWSDEERETAIANYGSREHPDYKRNILGLHGDASAPFFVLHRLMACVDQNQESDLNSSEYTQLKINNEMIVDHGDNILNLLDFPRSHTKYKSVWIGMDVGYMRDPSEILVFAEEQGKKKDEPSTIKLIARISLERVNHGNQVNAILWLLDFYKPRAFALDKTGLGLPLFQDIQERAKKDPNINHLMGSIKGYGFSEKILVDFDDTIEVDEFIGDSVRDAGMYRNVLEYSSDKLRDLVDSKRLILPFDVDLINEFKGQSFSYTNSATDYDQYGRKRKWSTGSFHRLDAARMAVLGWAQYSIEELTKKDRFEPVREVFLY